MHLSKPYVLVPSHQELVSQHMIWGEDTNIQTIGENIKALELDGRGKCLSLLTVYINNHSFLVIIFSQCIKTTHEN